MDDGQEKLSRAMDARRSAEDIQRQLNFISKLCQQYFPEIQKVPAGGHVRHAAAASLFRAFETLAAVLHLCDRKLGLEAHAIVDMAITLLWVGLDEVRAQQVWDKSVHSLAAGIDRAKKHAVAPAEVDAYITQLLATTRGKTRKKVTQMVTEAVDSPGLQARKMATILYDWLYDPLSAASHGDLRFAEGLVNGGLQEAFVPSALTYAAAATDYMLIVAAAQLGFQKELKELLHTASQS